MSFYLAIVSPLDSPLFELAFPSVRNAAAYPNPTPGGTGSSATASGSNTGTGTGTGGFPSWSSFTSSSNTGDGPGLVGVNGSVPPGAAGAGGGGMMGDRALYQMIAFKSLDGVEEVMEGTGGLYLRNVDKHNEWTVSAYLAMGVKFILLHDHKNDDGIRLFFLDLWELWVKVLLNPFHTVNTPIRNPAFDSRVRAAAKRHL